MDDADDVGDEDKRDKPDNEDNTNSFPSNSLDMPSNMACSCSKDTNKDPNHNSMTIRSPIRIRYLRLIQELHGL